LEKNPYSFKVYGLNSQSFCLVWHTDLLIHAKQFGMVFFSGFESLQPNPNSFIYIALV